MTTVTRYDIYNTNGKYIISTYVRTSAVAYRDALGEGATITPVKEAR